MRIVVTVAGVVARVVVKVARVLALILVVVINGSSNSSK